MFSMCTWGIHISLKMPKRVRQHWVCKAFLGKRKWGDVLLDFKSENRQFTGSSHSGAVAHRVYLANSPGVFLTRASRKILKVIKSRFPF